MAMARKRGMEVIAEGIRNLLPAAPPQGGGLRTGTGILPVAAQKAGTAGLLMRKQEKGAALLEAHSRGFHCTPRRA